MEISDELIERFFNNECNAKESEFVVNYLQENSEQFKKYAIPLIKGVFKVRGRVLL